MNFITEKHKRKINRQTRILENGCHVWLGYKDKNGYGIMNMKSKNRKVHRVIYFLIFGKIPDGHFVCHSCDNPSCINPDHLFVGTPLDNVTDMITKGRRIFGGKPHKGEKNGMAKLTGVQVLEIRSKRGEVTHANLARQYKVSVSAIQSIMLRKSWRHLK